MGIKGRDINVDINGATASVKKIMNAEPRRIGTIEIVFDMNISADQKRRNYYRKDSDDLCYFLEFKS
jgi:hypothetical protein